MNDIQFEHGESKKEMTLNWKSSDQPVLYIYIYIYFLREIIVCPSFGQLDPRCSEIYNSE